jgi:hypothetical protein
MRACMKKTIIIAVMLLLIVQFAYAAQVMVRGSIAPVPAVPLASVQQVSQQKDIAAYLPKEQPIVNTMAIPQIKKVITKITPVSLNITITSLSCPSATMQEPGVPAPSFDKNKDDCQLKANPSAVEQYLAELEAMVEGCKSRINTNRDAASNANQMLHAQIDQLKVAPPPDITQFQPSRITCSISEHIGAMEDDRDSSGGLDDNTQYTKWLFRMAKDVKYYCGKIDNMVAEVADECRLLNQEIECEMNQGGLESDAQKSAYHSGLNSAMDSVNLAYSNLETFYYPSTLKTYDFGNFRQYFNNGTNIDCSLKLAQPVSAEMAKAAAEKINQGNVTAINPVVSFFKKIFSWLW